MNARAHVYIEGNVQGVFFRSETMQRARMQNVMGWVRNLPDSRVEAVFEGEKENVMKMIEFCQLGPPSAIITKVNVFWEKHKAEFRDFTIRP